MPLKVIQFIEIVGKEQLCIIKDYTMVGVFEPDRGDIVNVEVDDEAKEVRLIVEA